MTDNEFAGGTSNSLKIRQAVLAFGGIFVLAIGYFLQKGCSLGIDNWFARFGALIVGLALIANFVDASWGSFTGLSKNMWGGFTNSSPMSATFVWIEIFLAFVGTFVWGFGDLWPNSACGEAQC